MPGNSIGTGTSPERGDDTLTIPSGPNVTDDNLVTGLFGRQVPEITIRGNTTLLSPQ